MLKSFETIVATPRKCPGRDLPSSRSLNPSTVIQVTAPAGYISSAVGANTRSTFSFSSSPRSRSRSRGYLLRSSLGPNCMGFTKTDAATAAHCERAACTSDRCPACSAPIVGTNPSRLPLCRTSRQAFLIDSVDVITRTESSVTQQPPALWACHPERSEGPAFLGPGYWLPGTGYWFISPGAGQRLPGRRNPSSRRHPA